MSGKSLPEDVLIATLHRVGREVRLVDDDRLAAALDEAAKEWPGLFADFRMHPQYRYSKLLSAALQTLDLGGGIVRDNAPLHYFRVSEHIAGNYGKTKLDSLGPEEVAAVESLARKIRSLFQSQKS